MGNKKKISKALVAFGANLEEPRKMIKMALEEINSLVETVIEKCSQLYLTKPQGGPSQDWYHNGVVSIKTSLSASDLMLALLEVEKVLGRVRIERWGPRVIDLDLLFYDEEILNSKDLILPHPRIAERAFVLCPLMDVDPDLKHPVTGLTVKEMLDLLPVSKDEIRSLGAL